MNNGPKISWVLSALTFTFLALAAAFLFKVWGRPTSLYPIPLVDSSFLDTATARESYADLVRSKADLSDFDSYACHERDKPPPMQSARALTGITTSAQRPRSC